MGRHIPSCDHLVVTADDFGLAREVNDAVEVAHRDGILTAASLMVAGEEAADAVRRAKRMPALRVGLHLVLVEGHPVLPRVQIPDLVAADGCFRRDMVKLAVMLAARPKVRRQLAEEIEAQFAAFAASGLGLDHVNAHKHFHLHPMVADIVMTIGRRYGLHALRVPLEPREVLDRVERPRVTVTPSVETFWARRLRSAASRAAVTTPDSVLGLRWSGAMDVGRLSGLLRHRPPGLVEIYTHPASADIFPGYAPGYRYRDELAALCDPTCRDLAVRMSRGGYADARSVTSTNASTLSPAFGG